MNQRIQIGLAIGLVAIACVAAFALGQEHAPEAPADAEQASGKYGLIGSMTAAPGQRDELVEILIEGSADMPGCLSYVVAKDPSDEQTIWITEVWDSRESHRASLRLPAVQDAMARGRPLIAGFGQRTVTEPVGVHGAPEADETGE